MVALSAGRVDEERVGIVVFIDNILKNAVSGRGAADVAETDKKYAHRTAVVEGGYEGLD